MIKRLLLILVISPFTQLVLGQSNVSFPTDSALWTMDTQTEGMSFPPQTFHDISNYKTNGDTLINGNLFTIISSQSDPKYCFTREANGLVYCKYNPSSNFDTTQFILYNFNLVQGDTLSLPIAGFSINYYPSSVYSVDSILIGNQLHKRIRINGWIPLDFVEGVGAIQGLMYPEIPLVDYWGDLTCFSRNDTIFSTSDNGQYNLGKCWYETNINKEKDQVISIYPNPTSGNVYVKSKQRVNVELFNIYGEKLAETKNNILHLQNYEEGIYLLKLSYTDGKIIKRKVIKQNLF